MLRAIALVFCFAVAGVHAGVLRYLFDSWWTVVAIIVGGGAALYLASNAPGLHPGRAR